MSNTELWDKLRRVPAEHLKGFKRAGGFTGTAIKPMWTLHRMTEVFGPCGSVDGWGIDEPQFRIVEADGEILVYCTVAIWYKEGTLKVYGVGGDKVLARTSNGMKSDDEAFKKAFTDAVTNALKHIGAGADVHMGLWDGNKYVDERAEALASAGVEMPSVNGDPKASKIASRPVFDRFVKEIRQTPSLTALDDWYRKNVAEIDKLPADHMDDLRQEFSDRKSELKKALAA